MASRITVGTSVKIRIRRAADDSGSSRLSRDSQDYGSMPLVRCRVTQVGIAGIPDVFSLSYEDGKAIGLPFWKEDFEEIC